MRNYDKEIILLTRELPSNTTRYSYSCPACNRGSFSVTNNGNGILYNCFRNKCGIRGFIPHANIIQSASVTNEPKIKEYKPIDTVRLNAAQVRFFIQKFDLQGVREYGFAWAPEYNRVYIPVRDWYGRDIGHLLRGYKELAEYDGPKTLNFKHSCTVPFAYYSFDCLRKSHIILVEDVISCLKVCKAIENGKDSVNALNDIGIVSLMGTNISSEMVRLLKGKIISLWLDADAFSKSLSLKENFTLLFPSVNVVYTKEDPKDLSYEQIKETLIETIQ